MFTERASVLAKCPECGNDILIDQVWYPGGANDYGSFEVECLKCKHHFDIYLGRDIDASSIKSGAKSIKVIYK